MQYEQEYDINQAAYDRLQCEIDASYPKGQFIGIAEGRVVANAENFETIARKLDELGHEPLKTMVVIAGDDTPKYMDILLPTFTDNEG
ncbi:MAG TPA: hypothetical protein VGI99_10630 [Gemmataceae bacterium]|jgi:hypothetical protein